MIASAQPKRCVERTEAIGYCSSNPTTFSRIQHALSDLDLLGQVGEDLRPNLGVCALNGGLDVVPVAFNIRKRLAIVLQALQRGLIQVFAEDIERALTVALIIKPLDHLVLFEGEQSVLTADLACGFRRCVAGIGE